MINVNAIILIKFWEENIDKIADKIIREVTLTLKILPAFWNAKSLQPSTPEKNYFLLF